MNAKKMHFMTLMRKQQRHFLEDAEDTVPLGGRNVHPSCSERLLGVTVSCDLTWWTHINKQRARVFNKLGALHRLCGKLGKTDRLLLANGTCQSILMFAATVWGSAPKKILQRLQIAQNTVARWVLGARRRTGTSTLRRG